VFNHKKAPNLYGMGLLTCFVTPKVEKYNFYKDLEGLLNLDDSAKKNEKEVKQKRE
jgi:hypothetical protein